MFYKNAFSPIEIITTIQITVSAISITNQTKSSAHILVNIIFLNHFENDILSIKIEN